MTKRRLGENIDTSLPLYEEFVASGTAGRPLVGCMRLKEQIFPSAERPPQRATTIGRTRGGRHRILSPLDLFDTESMPA